MIWIVLALCVLCIAMSCIALWYRGKWQVAEKIAIRCEELEMQNRELSTLRGKYEQLKGELGDMEVKCRQFRDHINILRSQLPKRDSRGRFCKRKEEK